VEMQLKGVNWVTVNSAGLARKEFEAGSFRL